MPKEYKECVKTEKKKHSEKDAKRICAISYWKRHGVSVKEAHKRAKKSTTKGEKDMKDLILVARSKEALKGYAREVAKSLNSTADDMFVIVAITKAMREDERLRKLVPEITDEVYKYALIRKSVDGKDFVKVGLEGGLSLDWSAVENSTAEEFNVPERHDVKDETVDVGPKDSGEVAKSMDKEEKEDKEEEEDNKAEKSVKPDKATDAKRRTEVKDDKIDVQAGDDPTKFPITITAKSVETLAEKIVAHLSQKGVNANVEEIAEIIKAEVIKPAPVVESNTVKSEGADDKKEDKKDEVGGSDKDVLGRVMSKVAKGEKLSGLEEKIHNAAIAAAKKESGKSSSSEAQSLLSKIMSKVAQGEKLSDSERAILAAAVDATKKARTEVQKSIESLLNKVEELDETPIGVYKSMTRRDPEVFGGMLVFTNKSEANAYVRYIIQKSITSPSTILIRSIKREERLKNKIPQSFLFVVELDG